METTAGNGQPRNASAAEPAALPGTAWAPSASPRSSELRGDPWQYLEVALRHGPAMAWRSPLGELAFVAWGGRRGAEERGEGAVARLRDWYSSECEHAPPPASIPLVVGGLPFSPRGDGGAWSAARLWRPDTLLVQRGGHQCQVFGEPPVLDGTSEKAATEVHDRLARLPSADSSRYVGDVHDAVMAIRRGELEKVVLARSVDMRPEGGRLSVAATAREMCRAFPTATVYAVALPNGEVLCGATPELIATVEDGVLRTQAVAGTGQSAALFDSEKDRHEHQLVVSDILDTLAAAGVAMRHAATPEVVASGDLVHLVTPIEGRLPDGMGVLDVVALLHPTAALCGTPRSSAMRWIRDHEKLDRGWYGGPIGWADAHGNGTFAVALRCALVAADGRHVRCFGGAGIVNSSNAELEHEETAAKMRAAEGCLRVTT